MQRPNIVVHSVTFHKVNVSVVQGDILLETSECLLNTPNHDLVAAVGSTRTQQLYLSCGPTIALNKDMKKTKWQTGEVLVTKANPLLRRCGVKYVIHNCCSVYNTTQLQELLKNTLETANQLGVTSLSIPTPCSGAYGLSKEDATKHTLDAIVHLMYEKGQVTPITSIRICNADIGNTDAAAHLLDSLANSLIGKEMKRS